MIRSFKIYLITFGFFFAMVPYSFSNGINQQYVKSEKEILQRTSELDNILQVPPEKTRSGFAVPRYVSLKVGKVNGRAGPSTKHKISWQYRRKGLPLIVIAETDTWRKVRDMAGDESWVHKPALSGIRNVITTSKTTMHKSVSIETEIVALVDKDALLRLEKCTKNWCKVSFKKIEGWVKRSKIWGAEK